MLRREKINKQKIVLVFLGIVLLIQTAFFKVIFESPYYIDQKANELLKNQINISETFINDTVRVEQRRVLLAIRQGWMRYSTLLPEKSFVKDNVWQTNSIKEIADIIVSPIRIFGTHSKAIIYDIQTGDIIYAPHLSMSDIEKLIDPVTQKANIQNLHKLVVNQKNEEQVKQLYKHLLTKVDTDGNSLLTSLISEDTYIDPKYINDFSHYPLGEYNRIFVEKIVLPHESIEIEEDRQLGLIIEVSEQEILSPYSTVIKNHISSIYDIKGANSLFARTAKYVVCMSLICIIVSLVYVRISENAFYEE